MRKKIVAFYWRHDIEIDMVSMFVGLLIAIAVLLWGLSVFLPPTPPSSQSITSE